MATDDRKVQLGVTVDATEARKGFNDVKDSARDMAQSVATQGAVAGNAIDSIGSSATASAQKVDAGTRSMIQSIQRRTASIQAEAQAAAQGIEQISVKGSATYYDLLAVQRGLDSSKIGQYTSALREAEAELAAIKSSLGGIDPAQQKFLQTLQSQSSALKDQIATFGMSKTELLAYQATQLGAGESAAPFIAQIAQQEEALKALRESTSTASAAVNAFGETEAEAAARIKDMVARSSEAQATMNATASASESAAKSTGAFGKSSEDVRATIAAQNAAMSATSREMAEVNQVMEALRAGAAQSATSFSALAEQENRLQLAMASGKMSMQEYDAMLAALWKDEDRLQQQVSALVGRYDPLNAATEKLAASQAVLEDAFKNGQVSSDQYAKALTGIRADQAAVQLQELAQQEKQLEKDLKSGQLSWSDYKTAISGIKDSKAGLTEIAAGADAGASALDSLSTHTKAARTEVLRLVNDLANGNFGRFDQSAIVLAEQMDLLSAAATPAGVAILGLAAGAVAFGAAAIHVQSQLDGMNQALALTGNYAGATVSSLREMAEQATAGGASIETTTDAITKLAATGRLASTEISSVGQATADAATYMGVSVEKMVDLFSELAKDPVKASAALNEQYHYLTAATFDQIDALEKEGDATAAAQLAVESFAKAVEDRSQSVRQNLGYVALAWDAIKSSIAGAINAVGSFGAAQTDAQKLQSINDQISKAGSDNYLGFLDPSSGAALQKLESDRDALMQKMKVDAAAAATQSQQAADNSAKITAQKAYDEWKKQFWTPQQKAADELQKYLNNIAVPLGLSPEQQLADEQNIASKYTKKSPGTGAVDKTQIEGDVQAVKDALAEELSAVASTQKQLDEQYKSGGVSQSQYYQQSRDLIMQRATDEVDAYNKEAEILQKGLNNQKLTAAQRAQILNQIADLHAKASKAIEDGMNGVAQSASAEDAAWDKYGQEAVAAMNKQIDAANQQDQSLKDQIDTFGMGKAAIDELKASRADDTVAALEQGRAIAVLQNNLADTKPWDDAITKAKQLAAALHGVASDQAVLDQKEAGKKVADQAVQDWKSAANSIESGLTNALMTGFNNGKSFGQQLADSLKSLFKTLILQPIIAPIAGSIAGMMYPGAAQAYAQTNPSSPLVGNPLGSILSSSNLSSAYNTVAGWFGGGESAMASGATSSIASGLGSFGTPSFGISGDVASSTQSIASSMNVGSSGSSLFSMPAGGSSLLDSAGSLLGAAGTGYGVGSVVGNLFGGGTAATGSQVGGTVGGIAGSFLPIPGGTLIGSAVGSALGGLVGSLFGGGETRSGALYDSTPGGVINKLSGPSGGDPAADQVQQQIAATYTQMQQLATSLGGSVTGLGDYRAGYEVSPSKGNSWVKTGFGDDVTTTSLSGVKDSTTVLNDLSLAMQQSVIKGLQEANLDKPYADYLSQFDSSKLSSDQVTQIESVLSEMKSLFDTIKTMGSDFDNLKNASTSAQLSVISLSGGIDQFNTNASYFEQNFVPAAEQTANQAKAVTDQLAALGESGVTTNDQFRQVVEGIDLTTDAGQQLYAQMLALAPAFNTMTQAAAAAQQAAQEAADQQQSLWDNYFGSVYTSDQQLAMSQKQLQAKFDALGVAMPKTNADFETLVENMDTSTQPMKDLQNALLALGPSFAQMTSAADQAQQAAQQAQQEALQTATQNVQTAYSNQTQAIQSTISSLQQFIKTIGDFKNSLALGDLSTLSPEEKYLEAKRQFESIQAAAAGGDTDAQGQLTQSAQDFLNASRDYNASNTAYAADYDEVEKALDGNVTAAQQQISVAQQQLDAANQMVQGILDLNQTAMTLEQAVTAYFAAGGTTSAAAGAAAAGTYGGSAGGNLNRAQVEATADPTTGLIPYSEANPYGPMGGYSVADWQAANGAVSDATKAAMGMTQGPDGTYGWYSVDGSHANGLDYVPFDGYIAELHKGERVQTAAEASAYRATSSASAQTPDWSQYGRQTNAALIAAVQSLQAEVRQLRASQQQGVLAQLEQGAKQHAEAQTTREKTRKTLKNVENQGK